MGRLMIPKRIIFLILMTMSAVVVMFSGSGALKLKKSVRNITKNEAEVVSNQALPGEVLEYTIYCTNEGLEDITDIRLFDAVPSFTSLSEIVSCNAPMTDLPVGITNCTLIMPNGTNAVGYEGTIEWQLNGVLKAGEGGFIRYRVLWIDQVCEQNCPSTVNV